MITEDDEFERIERENKMRLKEPLTVVYSIKLTQAQRIKLAQLGGPEWIRNQIERSTKLCSLESSDAGQIRNGCLHSDAAAGRGD
jgi:hypothetical protein